MKKFFAVLVLTFLFTGCVGTNQQSYLDEKIKCKKLAEEKFKIIGQNNKLGYFRSKLQTFSPNLDACLIYYELVFKGGSFSKIEDLLTGKTLIELELLSVEQRIDYALSNPKFFEELQKNQDEFEEKFKLYFGEDAE